MPYSQHSVRFYIYITLSLSVFPEPVPYAPVYKSHQQNDQNCWCKKQKHPERNRKQYNSHHNNNSGNQPSGQLDMFCFLRPGMISATLGRVVSNVIICICSALLCAFRRKLIALFDRLCQQTRLTQRPEHFLLRFATPDLTINIGSVHWGRA